MKKLVILMFLTVLPLSACWPLNRGVGAAEAAVGTLEVLAQDAVESGDAGQGGGFAAEETLVVVAGDDAQNGDAAATATPTEMPASGDDEGSQAGSNGAQSQGDGVDSEGEATSETPPDLVQASGPDAFPEGINPLTGLPVADPELLGLPPALVSVTNFPVSARPQAGLSSASLVFELYIGKGMTRFLALFYGAFPALNPQGSGDGAVTTDNQPEIGPVRSGRLPYQAIRQLYNGFLVMASASPDVKEATTDFTNIYGSDTDDINSALIDVTRLQAIAEANQEALGSNLTGNAFDPQAPSGGQEAQSLWMFYNFYNQARWEYDPASGRYLRFQDQADGSGDFYPATDRLSGEQLGADNVIVLFVKHEVLNSDRTLIDFDLLYNEGQASLLRDGQIYPVTWNTLGGAYEQSTGMFRPIRFVDVNGAPMALRPGNTWVEIVDVSTSFWEVEPGMWKARFYSP